MIYITGGAGFIGSNLVYALNEAGYPHKHIVLIDRLNKGKWQNLANANFSEIINPDDFDHSALKSNNRFFNRSDDIVIHLGGSSSTTDLDEQKLWDNNVQFSKRLIEKVVQDGSHVIYASSAATYGNTCKFNDGFLSDCRPCNAYAWSKHMLDLWVAQKGYFKSCTALKFFHVYGPNEAHKFGGVGRVGCSVVAALTESGRKSGQFSLFLSPKDQPVLRDFIYVKDVVDVIKFFIEKKVGGVFNVGTGEANSLEELCDSLYLNMRPKITNLSKSQTYVKMPDGVAAGYQYFTQANITKLREVGYSKELFSLKDGLKDYFQNHYFPINGYYK